MKAPDYDRVAAGQLDFCTWCPRLCHFSCPSAHGDASEASTAWGLMSLARHEWRGDVTMDASVARQFFHCASCGRCGDFCRHGHDVPAAMQTARARAHAANLVPAEVTALLDERAPEPGEPSPSRTAASIAVHLGCSTRAVWSGERVAAMHRLIERAAGEPVARLDDVGVTCCGSLAARAGDAERAERLRHRLRHAMRRFDVVLTDCAGTADATLEAGGPRVEMLVPWLLERFSRLGVQTAQRGNVTLHGGCRERRMWPIGDAEHALLEALGFDVEEAFAIEGRQECCGGDAVYAAVAPDGAARAAQALRAGASRDDAPLVTSRASCAAHLRTHADAGTRSVLDVILDEAMPCAAF